MSGAVNRLNRPWLFAGFVRQISCNGEDQALTLSRLRTPVSRNSEGDVPLARCRVSLLCIPAKLDSSLKMVCLTALHVVMLVCKNVLLLVHNHELVDSSSHYLELLWNGTVIVEIVLGLMLAVFSCNMREENDSDCVTCTNKVLVFLLALLDLILQAIVLYLIHGTDLCERTKGEYSRAKGLQWMVTLVLIVLVNLCRYQTLFYCSHCITTPDEAFCIACILVIYIDVTLIISIVNIGTSYLYECSLV